MSDTVRTRGPTQDIEYARVLILSHRGAEAIPILASLETQTESVLASVLLIDAFLQCGRTQDAVRTGQRLILSRPDDARAHTGYSRALTAAKRHKEALGSAKRGVELDPQSAVGLYTLGLAQCRCKHVAEARVTSGALLAQHPGSDLSHLLAGDIELKVKHWPDAERAYRAALRIRPDNYAAINNLACAYQRQGREAEAFDLYSQAAKLQPTNPLTARNLYITTHRRLGARWFSKRNGFISLGVVLIAVAILQVARVQAFESYYLPILFFVFLFGAFVVPRLTLLLRPAWLPDGLRMFYTGIGRQQFRAKLGWRRRLVVGLAAGVVCTMFMLTVLVDARR